ncbi:MAG: type II secretion system protein, partial [Limisphaerales bacterium]
MPASEQQRKFKHEAREIEASKLETSLLSGAWNLALDLSPNSQIKNRKSKIAFTLVELLVVIALIAILSTILLPVLSQAQLRAKRIQCLNNLRQMAIAAQIYTADNSAFYPIAYYYDSAHNISYCWDFTTDENDSREIPGVLWEGQTNPQIQQCPSFEGNANWYGDPYTGYNYNTSYIGHGQGEAIQQPA